MDAENGLSTSNFASDNVFHFVAQLQMNDYVVNHAKVVSTTFHNLPPQ